jgi:hypothetical protein
MSLLADNLRNIMLKANKIYENNDYVATELYHYIKNQIKKDNYKILKETALLNINGLQILHFTFNDIINIKKFNKNLKIIYDYKYSDKENIFSIEEIIFSNKFSCLLKEWESETNLLFKIENFDYCITITAYW